MMVSKDTNYLQIVHDQHSIVTQVQELNLWNQFLVKEKITHDVILGSWTPHGPWTWWTDNLGGFLLTTDSWAGHLCRAPDVTPPSAHPAARPQEHITQGLQY